MSETQQQKDIEQSEKSDNGSLDKQESGQSEVVALQAQISQLQKDLQQSKDDEKRYQADLANMIRRKDQEKELALKFAHWDFLKEFLFILDSLDSGLLSLKQPQTEMSAVLEGLEMMQKQMEQLIKKFDMTVISPEIGSAFDPNVAEAMSMQQNDEYPNNSVVLVIQKGYQAKGRILRPARVIVSKNDQAS